MSTTPPPRPLPLPGAMQRTVTVRPPKRAATPYSDRAQARLIRQKLIQHEQEIEDREALMITPEQLRILHDSFASVKTEFADLDGLSWDTPSARQILLNWHAQQAAHQPPSPSRHSPGGLRIRRFENSRSALNFGSRPMVGRRSTPITSTCAPAADGDISRNEPVRARLATPSPSPSSAGIGFDVDRTPLPRSFSVPSDMASTSWSSTSDEDAIQPPTQLASRPTFSKLRSAPFVPLIRDHCAETLMRSTKASPLTRIPVARSKSFFSKSSLPSSSSALEFTFDTNVFDLSPTQSRKSNNNCDPRNADGAPTGRSVLSSSPTVNQPPDSRFASVCLSPSSSPSHSKQPAPVLSASPSTISKRARAGGALRIVSVPTHVPVLVRTRATQGHPRPVRDNEGCCPPPMSRTITVEPPLGLLPMSCTETALSDGHVSQPRT